ncbi:hypothetical protein F4778DRAFT_559519 [Xylariomycetidae sp. FL2044]|nr:hypothetical protein F4778DRAFT_559519 [Xylariomycetidae sp. FL2044]
MLLLLLLLKVGVRALCHMGMMTSLLDNEADPVAAQRANTREEQGQASTRQRHRQAGPREQQHQTRQMAFEHNLIRDYELKGQDYELSDYSCQSSHNLTWSVAHGAWVTRDVLQGVQLFPRRWGRSRMRDIFGSECAVHLESSRNGLLLPGALVEAMDDAALILVPAAIEESGWEDVAPSEYDFRVLDPEYPGLREFLDDSSDCIEPPLDKKLRLQFQGAFRPDPRFLWLRFCCALLKHCWTNNKDVARPPCLAKPEKARAVWQGSGEYIPYHLVRGLVDDLGPGYAFLMEQGAKPVIEDREDDIRPSQTIVSLYVFDKTDRATRRAEGSPAGGVVAGQGQGQGQGRSGEDDDDDYDSAVSLGYDVSHDDGDEDEDEDEDKDDDDDDDGDVNYDNMGGVDSLGCWSIQLM